MDDPKRPPASRVYDIADRAGTPDEAVRLLAVAFPEAEPEHIAAIFRHKAEAYAKLEERYRLESKAPG